MRIKPKSVKANITLLTDPSPVAMSLVDQGACQTPFNVVKRDSVKSKKEIGPMANRKLRLRKGKGAKRNVAITKMNFSKSQFEDEDSVTDYLEDQGVEGYGDVTDNGDVWTVDSGEEIDKADIVGKAKATPGVADGVTVFVVELKDDKKKDDEEEDEEGDEEEDADDTQKRSSRARDVKPIRKKVASKTNTSKSDDANTPILSELATKYDWWGAYMSGEKSLKDVIKDGMSYDALPPGMDEVLMAVGTATGNILADDDLDQTAKNAALTRLGTEYANITADLSAVFAQAVVDAEKAADGDLRKSAKKFVEDFANNVSAARKGELFGDNVISGSGDDGEAEEEEAEEAGGEEDEGVIKMLQTLSTKMDSIDSRLTEHDTLLARSQKRRSMSDSVEQILGDDDGEEEADKEVRKQARYDFGSALGARPRSHAE